MRPGGGAYKDGLLENKIKWTQNELAPKEMPDRDGVDCRKAATDQEMIDGTQSRKWHPFFFFFRRTVITVVKAVCGSPSVKYCRRSLHSQWTWMALRLPNLP